MGSASAPTLATLASGTALPIAQLSPSIDNPEARYLHAAVILLWPFSSSTKRFSLLLSEPDFRLRGHKGQVKVTFHGTSAESIAQTKVGIGDIVYLSLGGVKWEERDSQNGTLTNCVDWDLVFSAHVQLEIHRNSQLLDTVQLDAPRSNEQEQAIPQGSILTPKASEGTDFTRHSSSAYTWSSPAFSQSLRASFGPLSQSRFDPLAEEEDGFVWGIGRKRTRFGRPSSEWTFVDAPPSPTQDVDEWNLDVLEDGRMEEDETVAPSQGDTIPFTQSTIQPPSPSPSWDHEATDRPSPFEKGVQSEEVSAQLEPPEQEVPVTANNDALLPVTEAAVSLAENVPAAQTTQDQDSVTPSFGDIEQLKKERPLSEATTPPSHFPLEVSPTSPLEAFSERATENTSASTVAHGNEYSSSISDEEDTAAVDKTTENVAHVPEHNRDDVPVTDLPEELAVETSQAALYASESPVVSTTTEVVLEEGKINFTSANAHLHDVNLSPSTEEHNQYNLDEEEETSSVEIASRHDADVNMDVIMEEASDESEPESYVDGEFGYARSQSISKVGSESYMSEDESASGSYLESEEGAPDLPNTERTKKEPEIIVLDSSDEDSEPRGERESQEEAENYERAPSQSPSIQADEMGHGQEYSNHEPSAFNIIPDREMEHTTEDWMEHHPISAGNESIAQQESPGSLAQHSERHGSPWSFQTAIESQVEHELGALVHSIPGSNPDQSESRPESFDYAEAAPVDPGLLYDGQSSFHESHQYTTLDVKGKSDDMDYRLITQQESQENGAISHVQAPQPFKSTATLPTPEFSQETQVPPFSRAQSPGYITSKWRPAREVSVPISLAIRTDTRKTSLRASEPPIARDAVSDAHVGIERDRESEVSREPYLEKPEVTALERVSPSIDEAVKPSVESEVIVLPTPDPKALGLRSRLSYFAPLSALVSYFNKPTDTLSVVTFSSEPSRAAKGPRDYFMTLFLTDPSMAGVTVCAQVFRKHKASLPAMTRGDAVLLRNFKVQSADHSLMLQSTESSSWAVFRQDEVEMNGPPVEYSEQEQAYASELRRWFQDEGSDLVTKHRKLAVERGGTETSSVTSSESARSGSNDRGNIFKKFARPKPKKHRRITIHELRHGRRYTEVGSPSDRESIHELRDGTVYAHL